MKNWYAVQTRSNYEGKVHDALVGAGVEELYPTYEKHSTWSQKRNHIIPRPLFPSYLFCRIEIADKAAVVSLTGVFQILGGSSPLAIPECEIQQVRLLMSSPQLLIPVLGYQPAKGDRVEVASGNFTGLVGIVDRWQEKNASITVWISSLGAGARVQVNADCLRKVQAAV